MRTFRIVVFVIASLTLSAVAFAKDLASGSTRAAILRSAGGSTKTTAQCFTVDLAAKRSAWAIVQTPASDMSNQACDQIQLGGYTILHHVDDRWVVVTAGDELGCPLVSRPWQPVIPSNIVRELTGLHCDQPTTAGHHYPRIPTEMTGKAGLAVEPHEIDFTGDGTGYLGGYTDHSSVRLSQSHGRYPFGTLVWATWNNHKAEGAGAEWLNNGIPDDAHGTFHPFQATIWASRPRSGVFTRMKVMYFDPAAPGSGARTTVYHARYIPPNAYGPGYWEWDQS